jgi:hypothetical protein
VAVAHGLVFSDGALLVRGDESGARCPKHRDRATGVGEARDYFAAAATTGEKDRAFRSAASAESLP